MISEYPFNAPVHIERLICVHRLSFKTDLFTKHARSSFLFYMYIQQQKQSRYMNRYIHIPLETIKSSSCDKPPFR